MKEIHCPIFVVEKRNSTEVTADPVQYSWFMHLCEYECFQFIAALAFNGQAACKSIRITRLV